jgi:rhodanese-related sulfurtransferase
MPAFSKRTLLSALALALLLPVTVTASVTIALISPADLLMKLGQPGFVLLDVRTPEEFAAGHIAGAVNIPHDQLANRAGELPPDRNTEIAVYCRSGRRSTLALDWLGTQGYQRLRHLDGDFLGWQAAGRPVTTAPAAR